jgi:hypothetical protein
MGEGRIMRPSFNSSFGSYIYGFTGNRAFNITRFSGWEKKHYIPDAPDIFGLKQDCYVYTSSDKKYMFTVTVHRDEVNLAFYFREKTDKKNRLSHGQYIPDDCKVALAIENDLSLHAIENPSIRLVERLPQIAELNGNAFFLVPERNRLALYFSEVEHGFYAVINPKSSFSEEFNASLGLLAASLERGEAEQSLGLLRSIISKTSFSLDAYRWVGSVTGYDENDSTILVKFDSRNDARCYRKLIDSLSVFKKYHEIPVEVTGEIESIILNKKCSIIPDRMRLAQKISDNSGSVRRELAKLLYHTDLGQDTGFVIHLARWFESNNNPDISIFLCMSFPKENRLYHHMQEEAKRLLLEPEYGYDKNEYYMGMLLTVAFRIALTTNKQEDIAYAMRLANELELGTAFKMTDINVMDRDALTDLLISKSFEIRQLREKLKNVDQSAAVSGAARLTFGLTPEKTKPQGPVNMTRTPDRRNSI